MTFGAQRTHADHVMSFTRFRHFVARRVCRYVNSRALPVVAGPRTVVWKRCLN